MEKLLTIAIPNEVSLLTFLTQMQWLYNMLEAALLFQLTKIRETENYPLTN